MSNYRPIGRSNFLNHQKQIQAVQQDHNPRVPMEETIKNAQGETEENYLSIPLELVEKIVHDQLRCPICLGVLNSTITLSTCLHRFCSDCFERSMRELKTQHGCPKCRAKLSSRRVSKPDAAIDKVVSIFQRYLSDTSISAHKPGTESELLPTEGTKDSTTPTALTTTPTPTNTSSTERRAKRSAAEVMNQETEQIFEIETYRRAYLERVEEFRRRQKEMLTPGTPYYQQFFNASDRNYLTQSQKQQKHGETHNNSNNKKHKSQKTTLSASPGMMTNTSFVSRRVFLAVLPVPQWRPDSEARPYFENNPAISSETLTLHLPFLKVNAELNIGELKQFFQLKLQLPETVYQRLEFLFPNQNQARLASDSSGEPVIEQWVILDECLTVIDVIDCLWNKQSELIFYYRCAPPETFTNNGEEALVVPMQVESNEIQVIAK